MEKIKVNYYEKQNLSLLRKILKQLDVPATYCAIGGYGEEAVCIEPKGNGRWIVYIGERDHKYNKKSFDKIDDACIEFISQITGDEQLAFAYKSQFDKLIPYRRVAYGRGFQKKYQSVLVKEIKRKNHIEELGALLTLKHPVSVARRAEPPVLKKAKTFKGIKQHNSFRRKRQTKETEGFR